jgi:hypothetical protein
MLFLGAGSSKPFGIKTMKEMSGMFENSTDLSKEEKELHRDIKNILYSENLEDILTVLNDLTNNTVSIKYITSYRNRIFDLAHSESLIDLLTGGDSEFHNNLRETYEHMSLIEKEKWALKSKIIHFIKENCVLEEGEERLRDIIRVYGQLFEILKFNPCSIFDIFTTNYDLIIEKYIENKKHIVYCDGFNCHSEILGKAYLCEEDDDPFIWSTIWNAKKYDKAIKFANELRNSKYNSFETIRLFKLHGSIDQYIQGEEIVKKDILFPTKTVNGKELLESMIYPMREKEVYKDPFFELFTRLKTSLLSEEICIIIGYSF